MSSPLDGWDLTRYRAILRSRAARLMRDPRVLARFDESDLTNETLLNAHQAKEAPDSLTNDVQRLGWLEAIQDNTLIDLHRQQFAAKRSILRERELESLREALRESSMDRVQVGVDPSPLPDEKAEQREMARLADAAIDRLDEQSAAILLLRKQGRTFAEIAVELGLKPASVAGLYYRALKRLKDQFDEE